MLDRCLDLLVKFEKLLKEKSLGEDTEDENEEVGSGRGSGKGRGGNSLKECRLDFAGE